MKNHNVFQKAEAQALQIIRAAAEDATILFTNEAKKVLQIYKAAGKEMESSYKLDTENTARLATIVETSDDAIISKDLNGIVKSWNLAAEKLFGYTPEEMIGKSVTVIIPPERLSEEEDILYRLRNGQRIQHLETVRISKDHRRIDVSVSTSPVIDSKGHIIGAAKIVRDITEKKKNERELEESHGLMRVIFEESFHFMGILKPDGTTIKINSVALSFIDAKESDILNKPFWEAPWWDHSNALKDKIHDAIKEAEKGVLVRFDTTLANADGETVILDFSLKPVKDKNGKIIFIIPEGRDISERKQIEDDLIAAKEAAEKAMILKSRFLDIAAHELRTPVTSFSLIVQLAQKQLAKGIPIEASTLMRLRAQSQRISRLVVDLLDVSRLERNAIKLQLEYLDFVTLIADHVEDFKLFRPNRNIVFINPKIEIRTKLDTVRILQVVSNLLNNACKYTPENTPIELSIETKPGFVRLSIKDYGPGISEDQQSTMFTAFTRGSLELTGRSGGLGLGLYVSRMIIELHGGRIGVISKLGSGSTFYFEIPIVLGG